MQAAGRCILSATWFVCWFLCAWWVLSQVLIFNIPPSVSLYAFFRHFQDGAHTRGSQFSEINVPGFYWSHCSYAKFEWHCSYEKWHKAVSLGKKQNRLEDFISAVESLVPTGYTSPKRLSIEGGSNGELLVEPVLIT